MARSRKLVRIETPPPQPGFLGRGHTARAVISGSFADSDPFILLMDDVLNKQDDAPAGGPHPHAGFETVSLLLEGEIGDDDHKMQAGDFQMMTAGSGVIHTETIEGRATMRLLQLWLNLPRKDRWATPRVQDLSFERVPKISKDGIDIRVYSGSLAGITSPVQNHVPLIVADIQIAANHTTVQQIPGSYNTLLYLLEGSVKVGAEEKLLHTHDVGWLDISGDQSMSELKLAAGSEGVRLVLYAAQPQGDPIVSYGPFIGDEQADIVRLYKEYGQGKIKHITTIPEEQKMQW